MFYKETRIVALPEWTHAAVGLVLFAGAALLIMRLAAKPEAQPCTA